MTDNVQETIGVDDAIANAANGGDDEKLAGYAKVHETDPAVVASFPPGKHIRCVTKWTQGKRFAVTHPRWPVSFDEAKEMDGVERIFELYLKQRKVDYQTAVRYWLRCENSEEAADGVSQLDEPNNTYVPLQGTGRRSAAVAEMSEKELLQVAAGKVDKNKLTPAEIRAWKQLGIEL